MARPHRRRLSASRCAGGMGNDAAARACDIAESASGGLDGLVSLGWAGALSCGVHPAHAYAVEEVVDADTGERFSPSGLRRCPRSQPASQARRLVTLDHVARAARKAALGGDVPGCSGRYGSRNGGPDSSRKGIVFYCFKAVSDAYDEILPDFSRYSDAEGQLRMPALLAHAAFRPKYWPAMARMGKNAKTGAVRACRRAARFSREAMQTTLRYAKDCDRP